MTIHGIGVDLVETSRIRRAVERLGTAFLDRIFTPLEQHYCAAHPDPYPHYAARFAAKEAVAKAFGTGLGAHAGWTHIEVVHQPGGAPTIQLSGAAANFAAAHGISGVMISLSHTRSHAIANALALY